MTTLHLTQHDVDGISAGADGGYLIELTAHGQQSIMTAAERIAAAGTPFSRDVWLRTLTNEELARMAGARVGGPAPDVAAEAMRRVRDTLDRLGPALNAMRSLGVLAPDVEVGCNAVVTPR